MNDNKFIKPYAPDVPDYITVRNLRFRAKLRE